MARPTKMTPPKLGKPGLIDLRTYNQLKGFLNTGKVVIDKIPLAGKSVHEIESLRQLEYLTISSLSALENTKIIEHIPGIPLERTRPEINLIIKDLKDKLYHAEKLTETCDRKSLKAISELDKDLEGYRDLKLESEYKSLVRDLTNIKDNFETNCTCIKRETFEMTKILEEREKKAKMLAKR